MYFSTRFTAEHRQAISSTAHRRCAFLFSLIFQSGMKVSTLLNNKGSQKHGGISVGIH